MNWHNCGARCSLQTATHEKQSTYLNPIRGVRAPQATLPAACIPIASMRIIRNTLRREMSSVRSGWPVKCSAAPHTCQASGLFMHASRHYIRMGGAAAAESGERCGRQSQVLNKICPHLLDYTQTRCVQIMCSVD